MPRASGARRGAEAFGRAPRRGAAPRLLDGRRLSVGRLELLHRYVLALGGGWRGCVLALV
jgi:hypothetical protein